MTLPVLRKILYVEDDPDIRLLAFWSLGAIGNFEVEACRNGQEALEKATLFAPDLLLLDVMMPDMDGPETLAGLREIAATQSAPVVFMTAKIQPHEIESYWKLGAIEVIFKPFDPIILPEQIQAAWTKHYANAISRNPQ